MSTGEALGILELESIARGVVASDALIKKALVEILSSGPVSGGKHLIFLRGGVAELEESMAAGEETAGDAVVDRLLLPFAHEQLWALIPDRQRGSGWAADNEAESVCIVETSTVCAAIAAADASAKVAPVTVRDMQLAIGISGKAFFTMTGRLHDIEAAAEAARTAADRRLLFLEVIAQPADEIRGNLVS